MVLKSPSARRDLVPASEDHSEKHAAGRLRPVVHQVIDMPVLTVGPRLELEELSVSPLLGDELLMAA